MINPLDPNKPKVEEKPQVTPKEPDTLGIPTDEELVKIHLARTLGLENLEDIKKYQDQLSRLIEWAQEKGAQTREDIAWQVKSLAGRVGGPQFGNNIVQHLSQWAYLELERNRLDRQMKEMSING